jgi:hypothetical protein
MKKQTNKLIKFSSNDIKAMIHDASYWAGIEFTTEQVKDLLANDKTGCVEDIWDDFEQVGHPGKYGMDTAVRDIWFTLIGFAYAGQRWPVGCDGEKVSEEFFKKLINGLTEKGISFNFN